MEYNLENCESLCCTPETYTTWYINYNSIKKEVEPECIKNILKFNYCILHPSSGAGNRLYDCTEYRKWTDEHYPETPHGGLEVALSLWDASPFR